jgi:hypothetical protein
MVWAGITATGKTPLVFVDRNVKINAAVYQQLILRDTQDPWAKKHFKNRPWTFQQDWAPAHSAKTTISLCKTLFPDDWDRDVLPPNSPDANPLDYSIWSMLESEACATRRTKAESLKRALKKAWSKIRVEQPTAFVDNFPKRLKAIIAAKGDHIENTL